MHFEKLRAISPPFRPLYCRGVPCSVITRVLFLLFLQGLPQTPKGGGQRGGCGGTEGAATPEWATLPDDDNVSTPIPLWPHYPADRGVQGGDRVI